MGRDTGSKGIFLTVNWNLTVIFNNSFKVPQHKKRDLKNVQEILYNENKWLDVRVSISSKGNILSSVIVFYSNDAVELVVDFSLK